MMSTGTGHSDTAEPRKTCTGCGQLRPLTDFHRKAASADGHDTRCKRCRRAAKAAWRRRNRPAVRQALPRRARRGDPRLQGPLQVREQAQDPRAQHGPPGADLRRPVPPAVRGMQLSRPGLKPPKNRCPSRGLRPPAAGPVALQTPPRPTARRAVHAAQAHGGGPRPRALAAGPPTYRRWAGRRVVCPDFRISLLDSATPRVFDRPRPPPARPSVGRDRPARACHLLPRALDRRADVFFSGSSPGTVCLRSVKYFLTSFI